MKYKIAELSDRIHKRVTDIRHDIHQHPETAYHETRTAKVIEAFLGENGINYKRCAGTGVTAVIGSEKGHIVGLRSEMDALSTQDLTGLPYASVNEGTAHACGHDGHIAILLGTAWVLRHLEKELKGQVKLMISQIMKSCVTNCMILLLKLSLRIKSEW